MLAQYLLDLVSFWGSVVFRIIDMRQSIAKSCKDEWTAVEWGEDGDVRWGGLC